MSRFWQPVLMAVGLAVSSGAMAVVEGDIVPATVLKHHASGTLEQDQYKGKVTLVNFWATWCAACKVELKEMEDQLRPLTAEKDFQVAYVSLDKEPEKAVEWMRSNLKDPDGMLKSLYVDSDFSVADKLKVDAFPMTFIIGKDGKIVHIQRGFKEGEDSTEKMVKIADSLIKVQAH